MVGSVDNRRAFAVYSGPEDSLFSIIVAAGWPIWPLLACSIIALALVIERFTSLKTVKVLPPKLLDEAITVSHGSVPDSYTHLTLPTIYSV